MRLDIAAPDFSDLERALFQTAPAEGAAPEAEKKQAEKKEP